MWRTMFSIMTMASSMTKPVPIVSAISDRLSRLKPQNHITPNVAISDSGSATPAIMVARTVRRNTNTTITTRKTLSSSVNCTSCTEARMVPVRSCTTVEAIPFGMARCSRGSSMPMPAHRLDDVGAGLALDVDDDGRPSWYQPPTLLFSSPSMTLATSLEHHRRAAAIGDDQSRDRSRRW